MRLASSGNKRFRAIVNQFKKQYEKCSRHEKTAMAEALVRKWREQSPPGRFLKFNDLSGLWEDVGKKARSKCSQLLREGISKNREGAQKAPEKTTKKEASEDSTVDIPEVPPPPPPPGSPSDIEALCETPPQRKFTSEFKAGSPCSVMDMPFYGVDETEEKDLPDDGSQCESIFSGMFPGLSMPRMPCRRSAQKATSYNSHTSELSALGSFLRNMLQEKASNMGARNISILQDNASAPPFRPKPATVDKEMAEHVRDSLPVKSGDLGPEFDDTPLAVNQSINMTRPIPLPTKISSSKRNT